MPRQPAPSLMGTDTPTTGSRPLAGSERASGRPWPEGRVVPADVLFGPALEDPRHGGKLAALPWVQDGLTAEEDQVLRELLTLLVVGGTDMGAVLQMPFLRSIDRGDVQAVRYLSSIGWEDRGALETVLEHPSLAGGITDEQTPVIASL